VTAARTKLRLAAPDEPPRLTPGAAEALLQILLEARGRHDTKVHVTDEEDEQ
jgi:hypothetical protein